MNSDDSLSLACEYFTRYGNKGVPGSSRATLLLEDSTIEPRIRLCHLHARTIISRFPELGDISERFRPLAGDA